MTYSSEPLFVFVTVASLGGGTDPNWWQRFQFQGVNPSAVLDFQNGLYWDGTTTFTSPSTMLNNGTITPGSGLLCNANNITLKGAALAAFQGGNYTVQTGTFGGTNGQFGGIVASSSDGSTLLDQLLVEDTAGPLYTYKTSANSKLSTIAHPNFAVQCWEALATSTSGTYRTISAVSPFVALEGGTPDSDANNYVANPFAIFLGSLTPQFSDDFGGYMTSIAITNSAAPSSYVVLWPAYNGPNAWWYNQNTGAGISYGTNLTYERTQPWTVIAPILLISDAGGTHSTNTGIIFSNVPDQSPYPGYELYIDGAGAAHVRVIHNNSNNYIGVYGSTRLSDGKWHVVAATYDGSSTAAGVNIYVDGVLETMTTESDSLSASIIATNQAINPNYYFIGNQSPATGGGTGEFGVLALPGSIGRGYRQYNVVKPLNFIQSYHIDQLLPTIDSSCVLAPSLSEGGASLTTADLSQSGFTGTLNNAVSGQWLRG